MADVLDRARRLGHEVFAPIAARASRARLNRPLVRALGEQGLLELVFAGSAVELCELREGLAHGCTEAETALALQGLGGYPILSRGKQALREEWIPRLSRGEAVAAFALSEPEAGSDAANLALRAKRERGGFRLTGTKIWISNAPEADVYSVFARTSDARREGHHGVRRAARERGALRRAPRAARPAPDRPARLRRRSGRGRAGARRRRRRLRRGDGHARPLPAERRRVRRRHGAGGARRRRRATPRSAQAFGKPLAGFQAVSHQLAEVATSIQAARLLVRDAAEQYDAGVRPVRKASAMAKLFATETAQQAVDVAIQVHGARALEKGHLLEHLYREVRAPRIYEGASEVQREIIARELFKEAQ